MVTALPSLLVYLVPKSTLDFNRSDLLDERLGDRDLLILYSVLKQLLSGKQLQWKVLQSGYCSRYDPASRNSTVQDGLSVVPIHLLTWLPLSGGGQGAGDTADCRSIGWCRCSEMGREQS